jgi:phosphatidylglycerol:prolipoprotein diacylglycerol transferase
MDFPAWDPVLLDIPGLPIDVRWYGLMYVVGFFAAQWILVRLARQGFFPVPSAQAPDLIFYAILGVMLGGRTGYALFYDHDLLNPAHFIQLWKGGLSFHGGLMGVVVAMSLFASKKRVPWLRVGDACALAVTPGILAVRFANFINGELYGRKCDATAMFAMRFPTDPMALSRLGLDGPMSMRDRELCIQVAYGRKSFDQVKDMLTPTDDLGRPIDWARLQPMLDWAKVKAEVPFRYPSQLFEGAAEGLLVGLLLFVVYRLTCKKPLRHGYYGAIFLLGYSLARFCCEFFREPDSQFKTKDSPTGTVLAGMTMGQTLSMAMVVGAALILLLSKQRTMPVPETVASEGAKA